MQPRWILPPLALIAAALWWVAVRDSTPAQADHGRDDQRSARAPDTEPSELSSPSEGAAAPETHPRESVATRGLLVRVLERDSRQPLQGYYVSMKNLGTFVGDGTSDARGRVELPAPTEGANFVAVDPPWGWVVDPRQRRVEPSADGRYEPLEFLAHASAFARFRARLVDELTGEPVPHYLVQLRADDSGAEHAVSDAEGRLSSASEYGEGGVRIECLDVLADDFQGSMRVKATLSVQHRPSGGEAAEQELTIPVGPTYRLALDPPPPSGGKRWSADFVSGPVVRDPMRRARETPLRWNDGPWVRFGPWRADEESYGDEMWLVVTSEDGAWYGEGRVQGTRGVQPEPIAIELRERGRVLARVSESGGEALANVTVDLLPCGPIGAAAAIGAQLSSANGLVEFLLVPPGEYRLSAIASGYQRRQLVVTVGSGERVDLSLELPRARLDGTIAGRILADGALPVPGKLVVFAYSLRPAGIRSACQVELERQGAGWAGSFAFEGLAGGDYVVRCAPLFRGQWTPDVLEVSTPARGLQFRAAPAAEPRWLQIEASDAVDQTPLPESGFLRERDGLELQGAYGSGTFVCRVPLERGPGERWWIYAPGHLARELDAADLREEQEVLVARVALARGWGLDLRVLGPGLAPLEGVEVLADGRPLAVTGADGGARLRRERAPLSLEVRRDGWVLEPGAARGLRDALHDSRPALRLLLAP